MSAGSQIGSFLTGTFMTAAGGIGGLMASVSTHEPFTALFGLAAGAGLGALILPRRVRDLATYGAGALLGAGLAVMPVLAISAAQPHLSLQTSTPPAIQQP